MNAELHFASEETRLFGLNIWHPVCVPHPICGCGVCGWEAYAQGPGAFALSRPNKSLERSVNQTQWTITEEVDKFDLAAARIPGLDHRTVAATQERLWTAGMQAQTHHLELVVKSPHLLPWRWKEMERKMERRARSISPLEFINLNCLTKCYYMKRILFSVSSKIQKSSSQVKKKK